jgi:hypothetical protein
MQINRKMLPEVEFFITSIGITVMCERLSVARYVPFDQPSKCRECRSTEAEIDFIVTKEGITIYCTRNKRPQFIPFDEVYELPGHCFFKIRNKGRVFNVPYGKPPPPHYRIKKEEEEEQMPEVKEERAIKLPKESQERLVLLAAKQDCYEEMQDIYDSIPKEAYTRESTPAVTTGEEMKEEEIPIDKPTD